MKASIILCLLFVGMYSNSVYSQVFDHNDPIVYYDENNPPSQPANGNVGKWVVTKRVNWNTSNYKSYIFRGMPFRLRYPNNFDPTSDKTYPLIIMWHGRGEAGPIYDNEKNLVHAARDHDNDIDRGYYDGFVMFPQNQSGSWGDVYYNIVHDLITNKISDLKVDPNRIITHGLSSGAYATWKYITSYPKDVAAALPMSGVSITDIPNVNIFKHIPIWLSQGGKDNAPSPFTSGQMVDAFTEVGGNIRYTIFLNGGHGIWNNAYAESDFWPFIMRANKTNPVVLSGAVTLVSQSSSKEVYEFLTNEEICPGDPINVTMGVTPGFSAYEWRKDGVVIPGQTANQLTVTEFGTYDVRFRRGSEWTNWSERAIVVKEKAGTVTPDIQVAGLFSKHKPSPDGIATVPLELPEGYVAYEWRKAGTTQTLSTERIFTVSETGSYVAKVTEQFGCSSDFSNEFQVIDANSANKPAAIDNLAGFTESKTSTKLQWATNLSGPNPATAFEIYRTESSGENYQLAGIVEAASLEFIDTGLNPNTTYYYIVRPINNYSAASVSSEVAVITDVDDLAPTAPLNLAVESSGSNEVSLVWDASTDDVGVFRYDIYRNGVKVKTTEETSTTIYNLQEGESYNFFVKARDYAGNESPFSNQAIGVAISNGVDYKYYLKSWAGNNLPNFNDLTPEYSGNIPNFDISVRSQNSNYGFLFESEINIPVAGSYTFETRSDDGSKLYIGDYNESNLVVNNDGAHGMQYREGTYVFPEAGSYKFYVTFYQGGGGAGLEVYWKNTAHGVGNRQRIPDSAFEKQIPAMGSVPTAPDSIVATAQSYKEILLEWKDMSDNENQFQIFRSEAGGDYLPIAMVSANETTYTDLGLKAATDYAYQVIALNNNGQSQSAVVEVSSLGHLTFEDQITDQSENSISNQMNGTTLYNTDSKEGSKSIEFDGNSYVDLDRDNSFIHSAFTERSIAFWIKALDANGTQDIYDEGGSTNGIGIRLVESDIELTVQNGHDIYSVSSPFARNEWHHVMGVFDNGSLRLFIDGNLVGERSDIAYSEVNDHGDAGGLGGTNGSNAFDVVSDRFHGLMDDFYVFGTALSNPIALMASSDKTNEARTFDAPNPPSAIMNFTAAASSSTSIDVSWDHDNLSDQYTLLQGLGEDVLLPVETYSNTGQESFLYEDVDLLPHTTYYYQVISENDGGIFESEIFSAITSNTRPTLTDIDDFSIRFSTAYDLNLTAEDEDGDMVNFTVHNLPSFASVTDYGDKTALITFNPVEGDTAIYSNIEVIVDDSFGGKDTTAFELTVNNNNPPTITSIADITLDEGTAEAVNFLVSDLDNAQTLIWDHNLPSFVDLEIGLDGSAVLSIQPSYSDHGIYDTYITVVDPQGASASTSFSITVNEVDPNVNYYLNFVASTSANSPWNNISSSGAHSIVSSDSVDSGVEFVWQTTAWNAYNSGAQSANNTGVFPNSVLKDYYYFGIFGAPETVSFKITGLEPNQLYDYSFLASSIWNGTANNGTTEFTIDGVTKGLYVQGNTQNLANFKNVVANSSGEVLVTMSKGANTSVGYINGLSFSTLKGGNEIPSTARSLEARIVEGAVELSWIDAPFNESGYKVYRSIDGGLNFSVIATVARDAESFIDTDVLEGNTFEYGVSAFNNAGESALSNIVDIIVPNTPPTITIEGETNINVNSNYTVDIQVSDLPLNDWQLDVAGLPYFGAFTETLDGGQISFSPSTEDVGDYEMIITANDESGLSSSKVLSITVSDNPIYTVALNFTRYTSEASPWNNTLSNPSDGNSYNNLKDQNGVNTTIDLALTSSFGGVYNEGAQTGDNSGVVPDNVLKEYYYWGIFGAPNVVTMKVSNLDITKKYSFEFIGSSTFRGSGVTDNGSTLYKIGNVERALYVDGNTSESVTISDVIADSNGEVFITMSKGDGAPVGYINGLKIRAFETDPSVFNPKDLVASANSSSQISLKWTDNSFDETGFEVYRATNEFGEYSLISTTNSNVSSYTDSGLNSGALYFYKVRAVKIEGYSEYTNTASAGTVAFYVNVNINGVPQYDQAVPWNNLSSSGQTGDVFTGFKTSSGNESGIVMEVVQGMQGNNDWGMSTGDDSGVYPDNVMKSFYFNDRLDPAGEYKLYGLDLSYNYNFTFFGSIETPYIIATEFSINDKTVVNYQKDNISDVVRITGVVPDEDGAITFKVKENGDSRWAIFNAFVIDAYPVDVNSIFARTNTTVATGTPAGNYEVRYGLSKAELSYYPNPVRNKFTIKIDKAPTTEALVKILDLSGNTVLTHTKMLNNVQTEIALDNELLNLNSGMYFVLVTIGQDIYMNKIIKE